MDPGVGAARPVLPARVGDVRAVAVAVARGEVLGLPGRRLQMRLSRLAPSVRRQVGSVDARSVGLELAVGEALLDAV